MFACFPPGNSVTVDLEELEDVLCISSVSGFLFGSQCIIRNQKGMVSSTLRQQQERKQANTKRILVFPFKCVKLQEPQEHDFLVVLMAFYLISSYPGSDETF